MWGKRRRGTEIDQRLKTIRKELSSLESRRTARSKTTLRHAEAPGGSGRSGAQGAGGGRFADYFSIGWEPAKPMRHQRKIQRNKAIVMSVFVCVVLFWIVYRFFL